MKKHISLITALLFSTASLATPVYHPPGSNLTYGSISNGQSIMSDITNPAAGASIFTKEDGQFRFGVFSSIGVGYEIGDVADLINQIDTTIDKFTDTANNQTIIGTNITDNVNRILGILNTDIATTNTLLLDIEKNGYFKGFASIHVPIMPLVVTHKAISGSFVLDINASGVGLASFLSSDVSDITSGDITTAVTNAIAGTQTSVNLGDLINSDSTTVIKGAAIVELSLGYSKPVWKNDDGQLFAGIRGNYYKVELTRFAQKLDDSSNQSLNDIFEANKDSNQKNNSGIGIDLGVLWVSEHSRAGATLKNINKPSFDFNTIDTSGYTDTKVIAALQRGNKYEMDPQLRLEGALFSANQNWVFGVALDANAIDDPVGQEYQWATASAAYATDSFYIPGFRVGYRANLAGTELTYVTTGITLFRIFNLDIAYGLEEITIKKNDLTSTDGTIPRSMLVNLGFELTF